MAEISSLFVTLSANTKKFQQSMKKVKENVKDMGDKINNVGTEMSKWVSGPIAAATVGLGALVGNVVEQAAEIDKLSKIVGFSQKGLQEWDSVLKRTGFSMEEATGDLAALSEKAVEARTGTGEAAEMFDRLGVSVVDSNGKLKSQEQLFNETVKGLQGMEDATERNAIATALLSTTGEELGPVLNMTNEELEELKGKANVISTKDIKALTDAKDAFRNIQTEVGSLFTEIAAKLAPILTDTLFPIIQEEVLPVINKFADFLGGLVDKFKGLDKGTQVGILAFIGIVAAIGPVLAVIGTLITVLGSLSLPIVAIVAGIGILIATLISAFQTSEQFRETIKNAFEQIKTIFFTSLAEIKQFLTEALSVLKEIWNQNSETIMAIVNTVFTTIKNIITTIITDIVPFIQEKLELIREFWDENGEQIMKAVQNAFTIIRKIIEVVMPIVQAVIITAWEIIKKIFSTSIDIILGAIKIFAGLFTGDFEKMKEGLLDIWDSLWNLITGVVKTVWQKLLKPAFNSLFGSIKGFFIGLVSDAVQWGKDLVNGFIDGILGLAGTLRRNVESFIANNVPGPVQSLLGIGSPSKLFEEFGKNIGQGLSIGIQGTDDLVARSSMDLIDSTIPDNFGGNGLVGGGGGGSSIQIIVNAGMGANGQEIGEQIFRELKKFERISGPLPIRTTII